MPKRLFYLFNPDCLGVIHGPYKTATEAIGAADGLEDGLVVVKTVCGTRKKGDRGVGS